MFTATEFVEFGVKTNMTRLVESRSTSYLFLTAYNPGHDHADDAQGWFESRGYVKS